MIRIPSFCNKLKREILKKNVCNLKFRKKNLPEKIMLENLGRSYLEYHLAKR